MAGAVVADLRKEINNLQVLLNTNKVDREVLTTMQALTSDRIFTKGQDAVGQQIGVYSRGYIKVRIRKGFGTSRKVILQLTQQMRNDWSVIIKGKDLGLGFKNKFNFDKSLFVEKTYKKPIFKHTPQELTKMKQVYGAAVKRHFK